MADINYGIDALKRGIEAAQKNIATFEDAIQREKNTINEYRGYITIINEKKRAQKGVVIDAQKGGVTKND